MVDFLIKKGYKVNVVTGFPFYPHWQIREEYKKRKKFLIEHIFDAKVYRYKEFVPAKPTFAKRIFLLIDFTFGSFINVLKIKKCDVVVCVVPHTSTLLLGWILKKRTNARQWNHIQDFEFDAAKETGLYSKGNKIKKMIFKMLFSFERKLLNQGNVNSTISYKMLDKLNSKSNKESFYFPNWIDMDKIKRSNHKKHSYLSSDCFKILYSGNIGDKQDWELFLLFVAGLKEYDVEIVVVGDGAKKIWLYDKIEVMDKVKYYPPVPYEELSDLLSSADLHVLFQKEDVVDSVMPSKLLGMMASGKPSLVTGNYKSEVRAVLEDSKGGFYIENNNIDQCLKIVKDLMISSEKSESIGMEARKFVIRKFSSEKVLANFENKLSQYAKI